MNPVKVFPIKFNDSQNTQSTSSSPQIKRKQPQLPEKNLVLNMSPVISSNSPIKGKFAVKRFPINTKTEDKPRIIQQQRLTIMQSSSISPKKRVISGANQGESVSPIKLPNLRRAETKATIDLPSKTDIGLQLKISKRKDTTDEGTTAEQSRQQQSRGSIIKLLSDNTPNSRPTVSRAMLASQTIDQDTKPKAPQQMIVLHGRSTSQAALMNNLVTETEMQDYIQLFYSKTQAGQSGNGQTKTNQDSVIVTNNLGGIKNRYIFSVCDGHGVYGHYVSQLVKKIFPNIIDQQIKNILGKQEVDITETYYSEIIKVLNASFLKMTKDLSNSGIDITFSGTTCSLVLVSGPHLWCANIGDSRSILIQQSQNNKWNIIELSNDHKPDLPTEHKRILASKGRVEPFTTETGEQIGPARVWLQHDQIPGLAMSRSFGDYVASTVGVSSEPEIIHHKMDSKCAFLVVASDGVWEFFSNEQIQQIILQHWSPNMSAKKIDEMCDIIIRKSTQKWLEEDEVVDDISIVIAYLHKP